MAASYLECELRKKEQKLMHLCLSILILTTPTVCLAGADCTGVALYLKMSSTLRPAQVHRKDCEGL